MQTLCSSENSCTSEPRVSWVTGKHTIWIPSSVCFEAESFLYWPGWSWTQDPPSSASIAGIIGVNYNACLWNILHRWGILYLYEIYNWQIFLYYMYYLSTFLSIYFEAQKVLNFDKANFISLFSWKSLCLSLLCLQLSTVISRYVFQPPLGTISSLCTPVWIMLYPKSVNSRLCHSNVHSTSVPYPCVPSTGMPLFFKCLFC